MLRLQLRPRYTGSNSNQTWEWNGESWLQRTPATSPGVRTEASAVYDSFRGRVILFAGANGGALADTWEWNGTDWTDITPSGTKPAARERTAFVHDGARSRFLMFAGTNSFTSNASDC